MKQEIPSLEDILADGSTEDNMLEVPLTGKIFSTFLAITVTIALVIVAQLFNIGGVQRDLYLKSAQANMTRADVEPAPRGIIKDRFGNPLVRNEPAFRAFISFKGLPHDAVERESALQAIADIIGNSYGDIIDMLENHDWRLGRLLLSANLSHDELIAFSIKQIPGIDIEPGFMRVPAHQFAFSHLLGYTGLVAQQDLERSPQLTLEEEIGKSGLELFYDDLLRGMSGQQISVLDAHSEVQETYIVREPSIGEDVYTFIDGELQTYLYERLTQQVQAFGNSGAVGVAVNPQNGEVLALVSIPSFDTNRVADFLNVSGEPLFNRAVSGRYNPGSTIKPLVAVAALEEQIVDPEDLFFSSGSLRIPNPYYPDKPSIFLDWKPHGWVNIYSALAKSSNVYFYIVGGGFENTDGLGIQVLRQWWQLFRLDKQTEIDLPEEKVGFLPSAEWKRKRENDPWRVGDTYNVSIGQGDLTVTPLELLNYVLVIANGGSSYRFNVAQREPEVLSTIAEHVDTASFEVVRRGMRDAVAKQYGTAHMLSDVPMDIAAKTGTAQVGDGKTNALFIGYGPFEEPEIALLIIIEDAREGSLNATPVARDTFLWYYEHRMGTEAR